MKALKIIGIVVLGLFALAGAAQLLVSVFALIGALAGSADFSLSYAIGRVVGAVLIETLFVFGLVKLVKSLRPPSRAA